MSDPAHNLPSGFRGLHLYRLTSNPIERIYAERWAEINKTGHILEHILSSGGHRKVDPSPRDYAVAATVVQWLGTIVGQGFLEEVARRASLPKTEPGGMVFAEHEVVMLRQLFGNTQLQVSLKGASLERVKRALPLGWVKLADWPTPLMHPFMDKVRRLLRELGDHDEQRSLGERFHRDIAGSKLVVFPELGHVPQEEALDNQPTPQRIELGPRTGQRAADQARQHARDDRGETAVGQIEVDAAQGTGLEHRAAAEGDGDVPQLDHRPGARRARSLARVAGRTRVEPSDCGWLSGNTPLPAVVVTHSTPDFSTKAFTSAA